MPGDRFAQLILESFYAELDAYQRYLRIAELAPTEEARRITTANAQDEYRHADEFEDIYEELTGMEPSMSGMTMMTETGEVSFQSLLRTQLLDEHADYKKYSEMSMASENPEYRRILYAAAQDEFRHALLDTYLLT